MKITDLKIKNFRNINEADFLFSDKTNIISGRNAQGKTNLMESICVAVEKSFRTSKASELLPEQYEQKEKSACEIEMSFFSDKYKEKKNFISCKISGGKIIRKINSVPYKEASKLYPQLKTIVFIPEDLYTVKGNPDKRRELTDETADMMNKIHHERTSVYLRALKQKNTFLSKIKDRNLTGDQLLQLSVWNEELAKAGVNVMCGRLKYFQMLSKYTSKYYGELNGAGEILEMKYQSSIIGDTNFDISDTEEIYNIYLEQLKNHLEKEIIVGHTLVGVHRDDIEFRINGKKAKDYASQGQVRSVAVALRLAQAEMFAEKWGESPVIILDDVLSELDDRRREFILKYIVNSQVFITGCNNNDFDNIENSFRWKAEKGEFKRIN